MHSWASWSAYSSSIQTKTVFTMFIQSHRCVCFMSPSSLTKFTWNKCDKSNFDRNLIAPIVIFLQYNFFYLDFSLSRYYRPVTRIFTVQCHLFRPHFSGYVQSNLIYLDLSYPDIYSISSFIHTSVTCIQIFTVQLY